MNKIIPAICSLLLATILNGAAVQDLFHDSLGSPIIREESPMWISYKKNFSEDMYAITFRWKNTDTCCGYTERNGTFVSLPRTAATELYISRDSLWQIRQLQKALQKTMK